MKSVFEYDDYRAFLRDYYTHSKATLPYFSFRYFARVAGLKAPNFLKAVMEGRSNLSSVTIDKFIKGLRLNKEESEFFRHLVLFNQAKNPLQRENHGRELTRSKTYRKLHPLTDSLSKYLRNWYFVAIRELAGTADFKEDPEWVAAKLCPSITPPQAQEALKELEKLGMLKRDAGGVLRPAHAALATPNEVASAYASQFHREMMRLASESINRVPREKRDISALTTGISRKTAEKVKEMIQDFRKELVGVLSDSDQSEVVYQLNFQFFPLTETETEKK